MRENCFYCGKDFENLDENYVSSDPSKHLCLACVGKIIDRLEHEICVLSRDIETLTRYNVLNELAVKQEVYNTLIRVRDGQ